MECKYTKQPGSIVPTKAYSTDAGYDLSVISITQSYSDVNLFLCDTGLCIAPPEGYYAEIHGRSSLPLKGYRLANNVGIVDPSYRGNLYILLEKIHPNAKDLKDLFPFRCCQLVFKKCESIELVESTTLEDTKRGSGGFGSSDS